MPGHAAAIRKAAAIIEVLAVFAVCHLAFRSFKHFTPVGQAEVAAGLNYSTGLIMIAAAVLLIAARGLGFAACGLTLKNWRYGLNIGLAFGLIMFAGAAGLVILTGFHGRAADEPSAALSLIGAAGFIVLAVLALRLPGPESRALSALTTSLITLPVLAGLLALPVVLMLLVHHAEPGPGPASAGRGALHIAATVGWLFLGAGFGEEIFFRGYIQSRINEAFGRPWRVLGTALGPGVIVSAALFGLVHVLNHVDYFGGGYHFGWLWGLMNFGAGVFFGCLREKAGSVLPCAIAHGLSDTLQILPEVL